MLFGIAWTEWLGYTASVIILIAFITTSIIRLRLINLVGSIGFGIYAFLIHSYPTVFLNLMIAAVNVYFLTRLLKQSDKFSYVMTKPDDQYLHRFLEHYQEDIQSHYPYFEKQLNPQQVIFYYLSGVTVVGVFIGTWTNPETLHIELDYVIPAYQDLKAGRFIYSLIKSGALLAGVRTITIWSGSKHDNKYLQAMGFKPQSDNKKQDTWVLTVKD